MIGFYESAFYSKGMLSSITDYPQVAISILHWGNPENTANTLRSLEKITYPHFHVFLVDQTQQLCLTLANKITLIVPERNLGFGEGHNLVLKQVMQKNFEYALLLNNDVTVEPNFLTLLVDTLERHPNAAAAGPTIFNERCQRSFAEGVGQILVHQGRIRFCSLSEESLSQAREQPVGFISGCSMLLRMKFLHQIGLIDPRFFMYWEDADWCVRMKKLGYELYYQPQAKIGHFVSSGLGIQSPILYYYGFRNNLLFNHLHTPTYSKPLAWLVMVGKLMKASIRILWKNPTNALECFRCIYLGIDHYFHGHFKELRR